MDDNKKQKNAIHPDLRLYTPAEVQAILKISERTLKVWMRTGKLPHTTLGEKGRLKRIKEADLLAFVAKNYNHKNEHE